MKRVWKELFALVLTFGPAVFAVLVDVLIRRADTDEEGGEGG